MARAHRVAGLAALLITAYTLVLLEILQVPFVERKIVDEILPVLPWWLLVSFGSYSLFSLGWGVFTFRDCPEAYHELLNEISEAKNDLQAKGVSVD
ncbi:dolichol-phosphate mannosyltransferase subunit 3 [Marasmius fiardii PR-910]|nr:dolichol-phosphate mannosyltransferase subunit 3 [Marasmius fiardii PR-910]